MHSTVTGIAAAVRAGELTARDATEAALARIAERDPAIGAFQVVRTEAALREADGVDQRADRFSLPLAGVPIPIKDNVPVSGEPMRNGSLASDATPREFDHEIVRRLRRAGAVVVGLTRVPELCVFGATDSAFGITRNPWQPAHTPGGSSGGAAAAVAAGMVPAAHGNDGMGSIRIPAACCGLVGIKAGLGVVPSGLGNGSWFDMAENGPLATTVADTAAVLAVLAARPELAEIAEPGALRVAVSTRSPSQGVQVHRSWAEAARAAGSRAARGRAHRASGEPRLRPAADRHRDRPLDGRHRARPPGARPSGRRRGPYPPARRGRAAGAARRVSQGVRSAAVAAARRAVLRRSRRAGHPGVGAVAAARGRVVAPRLAGQHRSRTCATPRSPRRGTSPAGRR